MKRLIGAALAAATLTACSGGSVTPVAQPSSQSPPATASPTPSQTPPAPLTIAAARTRYLATVAPFNKANDVMNQIMSVPGPLTDIRRQARVLAGDARAIAEQMRATRWPVSVRPAALAFADATAGDVAAFASIARATSTSAAVEVWNAMSSESIKDAEIMRERLGLPSVS